jgi:hypothetical protein
LAVALLIAGLAVASLRLWPPASRSAADLGVAAAGFGIGFAVFAQDYAHFAWQPGLHISSAAELPTLRDLPFEWNPATGFALTLLGAVVLVAAAVIWLIADAPSPIRGTGHNRRIGGVAVGASIVGLLGSQLSWIDVVSTSAGSGPLVDTQASAASAAAAVLLVVSAGYWRSRRAWWPGLLAIASALLFSVAVYQWMELRQQANDLAGQGASASLGVGIYLTVIAGLAGVFAAAAALITQRPRAELRQGLATAGVFLAVLVATVSLSAQDVSGQPRSCQGTGFFGVDKNGHEISGCLGSLYESR